MSVAQQNLVVREQYEAMPDLGATQCPTAPFQD